MGNDWGSGMADHSCIVGIIRIPGLGWPVRCGKCKKRIGYGKTQEDARKIAQNHRKNN